MILASAPCASNAAEKGWFGFALAIDAEGSWFSPKLRSIKIDRVFPASPAAKADNVKAAVQKSVGETLRLKYQRGSDPVREVALIAATKPPG
jgi:hypothetical protein